MKSWYRESRKADRPRSGRSARPALEGLDARCLLDGGGGPVGAAVAAHLDVMGPRHDDLLPPGVVVKVPSFYEHYVGPRLPQLNAVAAAGELLPDGSFLFAGLNQGDVDPNVPQTYVWGVDRSGTLKPGPFPDRPDVRFDAIVVLKVVPGQPTTATVIDLTGKNKPTPLPPGAFMAAGRVVDVVVPGSALPSTGLAPSQYLFNYWPEDGQPGATHIASFAPEFTDAQVGVIRADRHGDDVRDAIFLGIFRADDNDDGGILGDGHRGRDHGRR